MKRQLIILSLGMAFLLFGCANQQTNSLEAENKLLKEQIESLEADLARQSEIANVQRAIADSNASTIVHFLNELEKCQEELNKKK